MMADCLFCKIASHQIPSRIILENDQFAAFEDINPQAPVHFLVIPKKHLGSLAEASADETGLLGTLLGGARTVAEQLKIRKGGYRVVINTGAHGGQTVDHLHLHVLGGRAMEWPPG